jgi:hypothetical protein
MPLPLYSNPWMACRHHQLVVEQSCQRYFFSSIEQHCPNCSREAGFTRWHIAKWRADPFPARKSTILFPLTTGAFCGAVFQRHTRHTLVSCMQLFTLLLDCPHATGRRVSWTSSCPSSLMLGPPFFVGPPSDRSCTSDTRHKSKNTSNGTTRVKMIPTTQRRPVWGMETCDTCTCCKGSRVMCLCSDL